MVWLCTYLFCSYFTEPKIEWDEAKYLATARGICENLDFSSRSFTVLGLIKYGYPLHNHHYPLHSIYIALFFKLFGTSLKSALFATWFSALIACIFIYLTSVFLTSNNVLSFLLSLLFLFFPRILDYCNSAMMEIPSCALISVLVYFVFAINQKSRSYPIILALVALILFLFKSLFVGILLGLGMVIVFLEKPNGILKIFKKLVLFIFAFFLLYFVFTKFVFLPLAPWLNFLPSQEGPYGSYADFVGGFFNNIPFNLKEHLNIFFEKAIFHYYPFLVYYFLPTVQTFYPIDQSWFEYGIYFLMLFYVFLFSIFIWKSLSNSQRLFIVLTLTSIIFFTLIFITITVCTGIGLLFRYSLIYLPLLLLSFGIILAKAIDYFKSIVNQNKIQVWILILSFIFLIYIPVYFCSKLVIGENINWQSSVVDRNSKLIEKFIGNSMPMFIYFTGGSTISWDMFPVKEIFMDATSDQIKKINMILPEPIEFLFIKPENNLFKENASYILNKEPIISNSYIYNSIDLGNKVIIYRSNKNEK